MDNAKKNMKEAIVAEEIQNEAASITYDDIRSEAKGKKAVYWLFAAFSTLMCLFHLYATFTGTVSMSRQKIVHLCLVAIIAALYYEYKLLSNNKKVPVYVWVLDAVMILFCIVTAIYMYAIDLKLYLYLGSPTTFLVVLGLAMTVITLIVSKRSLGWVMPVIALVALAYVLWGHYLGGVWYHRQYSLSRIANVMLLSSDGLLGSPINVSAGTVSLFVIFGSILSLNGGGQAFIDIAYALFGRIRGGPAKVAVVSSALFGTINGASVANVVTTGTFTIPLMKKVGYDDYYAGAVEAVASTGGQIMPPVMGAAAFVMAQVLGVPYLSVVKAAIIPAFLYFFMLFISVDFKAVKKNLQPIPKDQLPSISETLKKSWFLLLPLVVLIILMVGVKLSANKSALYAIFLSVIVSFFSKENRFTPKKILEVFVNSGKSMVGVSTACATAGIIIGCLSLTGLATKLSSIMITLAGGNLYILMLLIAIAGIILGMGLPTTGVYVILATLAAPALVQIGVEPMAAHMYAFYYGVIAVITPPVAMASYAAAGIAGAKPSKTGWEGVRLGLVGFILPVMFVLNPPIMMNGTTIQIIQALATSILAVTAMSAALNGVYIYTLVGRIAAAAAAVLLLDGGTVTDIAGVVLAVVIFLVEYLIQKKKTVQSCQA